MSELEYAEDLRLLAIDTSLGTAVAVGAGDSVISAVSDDPRAHAEVIGDLIAEVLRGAGWINIDGDASGASDRARVDAVVMGVGPGSFTGLRVGMAAAHGYAQGAGVPLFPVLSHEAAAFTAAQRGECTRVFRVVQDAKRREYFVSEWRAGETDVLPELVKEPYLLPVVDYAEQASDYQLTGIDPAALIRVAQMRLQQGLPFLGPEPWYLREPDVKPPAPVKQVSKL